MEISGLDDSVWFNALTLGERAASLRAASGDASAAVADDELAEKRIRRWRALPPFDNPEYFSRRLAVDLIDEQQLRSLLGEPVENLRGRVIETPGWLERIRI